MSELKPCPVCKGQSGGIGSDGVENDCMACFTRDVQASSPRVEACIASCLARYHGESKAAQSRYFEEVHQHLAPLARSLEIELAEAKAELARRTQPPEAIADKVDALLVKLRKFVDERSQDHGYGFFRPENPHDFTPDADQCSEEEIAAHKAACDAFDKGEYTHDHSGCIHEGKMHILHAPWGIGGYVMRDPEAQALIERIEAVRQSIQKDGGVDESEDSEDSHICESCDGDGGDRWNDNITPCEQCGGTGTK